MKMLNFRLATEEDAAQLHKLVETAFRTTDSRKDWTDNLGLVSSFRPHVQEIIDVINKPDSVMLMATNDQNTLVGAIGTSKRDENYARLFRLAVDTSLQRGGIGRQILEYAEDYCRRTWGVRTVGLDALSCRKSLLAWYLRCGYKMTGETTPFPREKIGDLVLPDDLCFVEFEKAVGETSVE
ncbi:Acyl-CoA N-acyltransferase [Penicillium concentricum]|uniref:Acyl-CoA N-acyltransferase n=1 Tax=Penicillium concentricum TaxID=293559 RepID=A0A9W9RIL2_9EURO|nr:Acyl-CoA N-acyltransferase [Penicillium concentricum]KAJ5360796.1 Acyl-CoA N-acyltransferase [Penicillium concentricum]